MFKKEAILSVLLWMITVCVCFGLILKYSPGAEETYHQLIDHKKENINEHSLPSEQKRYEVTKQILYTKGGKRLQSRLASEKSDLIFNHKDGKREIVENFTGLKGSFENSKLKATQGICSSNKQIELRGDIHVEHGIGQIAAQRLSYVPGDNHSMECSGNVEILLKDGGKLVCQQGKINCKEMKGIFTGNDEFPIITYKTKDSVVVNCLTMKCDLIQDAQLSINQIEAIDHVHVTYQEYNLFADLALYERLGLLTLTVAPDKVCQLTNLKGDCIEAKRIEIKTAEKNIKLFEPDGKLSIEKEILKFKSDELVWDQPHQFLELKGAIDILQNGNLNLKTDHQMSMSLSNRSLQSPEKTYISYMDSIKGNMHRIYSPGPFQIDHEHHEMTFQGTPSDQVFIEDCMGEIYADTVKIHYLEKERKLQINKIIMEGNVLLSSRFDGHIGETGAILHEALADRLEYFPEKQEMLLSSHEGNRVLLEDKVNNIQMSAPALKLQRNQIQGIGDVRLSFLEKELAQFKNRFKEERKNVK